MWDVAAPTRQAVAVWAGRARGGGGLGGGGGPGKGGGGAWAAARAVRGKVAAVWVAVAVRRFKVAEALVAAVREKVARAAAWTSPWLGLGWRRRSVRGKVAGVVWAAWEAGSLL